ncbi:hypothetical protein PFFVO_03116 [Plasmodium falciparum Vietnam Oak-Knoll (FVO)]|uniref:Surface antigen n=1 Tax=Plasmodium falciparum Vietnam Oak-Knoll (FVO) TaxID=1036723 RepID=A0A024V6Z0_PLAFA|nr:hypothetical protein PFFVO_03116 [Plasmodium falciparum Vietnam Oak-Knoll (FVO)]
MKLHFLKILLFFFLLLNILVTSYQKHNKNKLYITRHTRSTTSRLLSECDIKSSIYVKDADMKSVKENFDRQTSQRFEEYEERMITQRKKYKEQCEKDIQRIILKDKRDKSLADKIEKGCLRCGCGLGGVAASVGIFGSVAVSELAKAATATAIEAAKQASMVEAISKGTAAGAAKVIELIKSEYGISTLGAQPLKSFINPNTYTNVTIITQAVHKQFQSTCLPPLSGADTSICTSVLDKSLVAMKIPGMTRGGFVSNTEVIKTTVKEIVAKATTHAAEVTNTTTEEAIKSSIALVDAKYVICQTAIIASVVAILIIVLVMIIIYLVLRYRRKKKMHKKAQYTKLLNQ